MSVSTSLFWRILGDLVGCITLAFLLGLILFIMSGEETTQSQLENTFFLIYWPLLISGYVGWHYMDKENPSWFLVSLGSIGVGIIFFL